MATRHALAVAANETTDLLDLAAMLADAVREVLAADGMPFKDPAVRFICFRIAFAGNGDISFYQYYTDIYHFCIAQFNQDQLGFPAKDKPNEPIYKTS